MKVTEVILDDLNMYFHTMPFHRTTMFDNKPFICMKYGNIETYQIIRSHIYTLLKQALNAVLEYIVVEFDDFEANLDDEYIDYFLNLQTDKLFRPKHVDKICDIAEKFNNNDKMALINALYAQEKYKVCESIFDDFIFPLAKSREFDKMEFITLMEILSSDISEHVPQINDNTYSIAFSLVLYHSIITGKGKYLFTEKKGANTNAEQ